MWVLSWWKAESLVGKCTFFFFLFVDHLTTLRGDVRPNIMRLIPSSRKRLAALPVARKQLQDDLRAYIRVIGPALGEIYYGKDVDWAKIQEAAKQSESKKAQ